MQGKRGDRGTGMHMPEMAEMTNVGWELRFNFQTFTSCTHHLAIPGVAVALRIQRSKVYILVSKQG